MLELAMQQAKAHELLDDPTFCGQLTMGAFEALLVKAGYSAEVAHKAALERGWDRLEQGKLM